MKITRRTWMQYVQDLRKISDAAATRFAAYISTHDVSTYEGKEAAIQYAHALATKYGEGASEMACQMYDAVAEASGKTIPPAVPAKTPSYGTIAKNVWGTMKRTQNPDAIGASLGCEVKRVSLDTIKQNAARDGAEFAWIPSGDSCPFCLTLASNGWRRISKKALDGGHKDHVHPNCDCTYAVRFDKNTEVEGYDPDALYDQYRRAEGVTSAEKINYMRRAQYAVNKDAINAQKRAAYAKRKTRKAVLDRDGGSNYNTSPVDDNELKRRYNRDVRTGWISALSGFNNYKKLCYRIEQEIVGLETKSGLMVKSQSEHFLARVIGSSVDQNRVPNGVYKITGIGPQGYRSIARTGVEIEDIRETVLEGRPYPIKTGADGLRSQRFKGSKCVVTINPDTGNLIQCNPGGM